MKRWLTDPFLCKVPKDMDPGFPITEFHHRMFIFTTLDFCNFNVLKIASLGAAFAMQTSTHPLNLIPKAYTLSTLNPLP